MANFFNLTLDTLGPASPSIIIDAGASYSLDQIVDLTIGTTDPVTTGYQMKIWGDVDNSYDTNIQTTEATSSWITYATAKQVKVSNGDGLKTIYCKIRDDVYNVSSQVSDTIVVDTSAPVVNIVSGPDTLRVSKQSS